MGSESGETIRYAYFPHTCVISLLAILEDGSSAEVALFGCEGVVGVASSFGSRESFGRYVVQLAIDRLEEALDPETGIPEHCLQRSAQCRSPVLPLDSKHP